MIPLSSRHSVWLVILLLLLARPISLHAVQRPAREACANPAALMERDLLPLVDEFEAETGLEKNYIDTAWGTLDAPGRWHIDPRWRLARTLRHDEYYYGLQGRFEPPLPDDRLETRWVDVDGTSIPIRIRIDETRQTFAATAYLLILGGRPVDDLLWSQIRTFPSQLVSGTDTLTVLVVNAHSPFPDAEANLDFLTTWTAGFWPLYQQACASPPASE